MTTLEQIARLQLNIGPIRDNKGRVIGWYAASDDNVMVEGIDIEEAVEKAVKESAKYE